MNHTGFHAFLPLFRTALLFLVLISRPLLADQPDTRHGSVEDGRTTLSFEGGFTLTWQHASASHIDDEAAGSLDLVATLPMGGGIWTLYVEGSTTPATHGVSAWLPEANADVGTALNSDGHGRLQVSVLHYTHPLQGGQITAGLLDPTGFLDRSEVANDETRQFLGTSFVNNTVIEFPDYHLALTWHHNATLKSPGITLLAGSSHGLTDNDGSYAGLVHANEKGKGVFAAAEGYGYLDRILWRFGIWCNTADHPRLDDPSRNSSNWGLYTSVDGNLDGGFRWNIRLGWTTPKVSEATNFVALVLEHSMPLATIGAGISRTGAAPDLEKGAATLQAEFYARFDTPWGLEISPDVQWIRNSGLDRGAGDNWVAGIRATYLF